MFRPREGYLQVFSVAHSEVQAGEFCVVWLRPLGTHEWSALKCGIQLTFIQSVWYCACPERLRGSKNGFLQLLDITLTFWTGNSLGAHLSMSLEVRARLLCSSISRVKLMFRIKILHVKYVKWVTEMYPVFYVCWIDVTILVIFISIWISLLTLLLWNLSS